MLGAQDSVVPQGCLCLSHARPENGRARSYKRSTCTRARVHIAKFVTAVSRCSLWQCAQERLRARIRPLTSLFRRGSSRAHTRALQLFPGAHGRSCIEQRLTSCESTSAPFPVPLYTCGHLNGLLHCAQDVRALVIRGLAAKCASHRAANTGAFSLHCNDIASSCAHLATA